MADRVLAIDLGKTTCRAALWQAGGCTQATGAGFPGLASTGGAVAAEAAILAVATPLLAGAQVDAVGVGVAGALAAPDAARDLARRLCLSLPAAQVAVASDAIAAHLGALGGQPGLVLIMGTGAVAVAVRDDGALHQVDGLGPWLGDAGGGAWLGLQALRLVARQVDGGAPASVLRTLAEARFGPIPLLARQLAAAGNPAEHAASFAPDVVQAALDGDDDAAGLLQDAAGQLHRTLTAAASWIGGPSPRITIVGGLAAAMAPRIAALGGAALHDLAPDGTALDGAARLATQRDTRHEAHVQRVVAAALPDRLDGLATEAVRPGLEDLDQRPAGAIVHLVLEAERAAQEALGRAAPRLAEAADAVAARMQRGGRLFYLGAGTPGRLAVLDAAELGPTYSAPPGLVVALLAGGAAAVTEAAEGAEDDTAAAARALDTHGLTAEDSVVGITASGRTPFVVAGLRHARDRGALTVAIVNNAASPAAAAADHAVAILTGAELVAGSTRMAAGTTQKIALNALSTAAMVALGKTYGARMVDVRASNDKLRRRALRMVCDITGADAVVAAVALEAAGGRVKPAIVALLAGVSHGEAERRLGASGGRVRPALEA